MDLSTTIDKSHIDNGNANLRFEYLFTHLFILTRESPYVRNKITGVNGIYLMIIDISFSIKQEIIYSIQCIIWQNKLKLNLSFL